MGRTGNEYWQFNPALKRRCPPCEGEGILRGGSVCGYCDGTGRGGFSYSWRLILPAARRVVLSYKETGVTLRQLFYRLVAAEMLPNTAQSYGSLSEWTAKARREEGFPALIDNVRSVERPHLWDDAAEAADWLLERYMEPRASTQEWNIYVGVEKNGLKAQLFQWFAPLGLPVLALGGYSSQTLADEVATEIREDGRPAVMIYAGDFDADGVDIPRDFRERVGCFEEVERVALTPEQIEELRLPPQPGKWSSSRARAFAEEHAELFESVYGFDLVQIELDAIPPDTLRSVYREGIDEYFDIELWRERVEHEKGERAKIAALIEDSD